MRRLLFALGVLAAFGAILASSIVLGYVGSSKPHGAFDWELWALVLTGLGTTALAVATGALAFSTWQDVRASQQTASTVVAQAKADRTPLAYPVAPYEWDIAVGRYRTARDQLLVIRNGGRGIALRVTGWINWDDGADAIAWSTTRILPTTIAAGETQDVRLDSPGVRDWRRAYGVVDYEDVSGLGWRTSFKFNEDSTDRLYVEVEAMGQPWAVGDPPEQRVDEAGEFGPPLPPPER